MKSLGGVCGVNLDWALSRMCCTQRRLSLGWGWGVGWSCLTFNFSRMRWEHLSLSCTCACHVKLGQIRKWGARQCVSTKHLILAFILSGSCLHRGSKCCQAWELLCARPPAPILTWQGVEQGSISLAGVFL